MSCRTITRGDSTGKAEALSARYRGLVSGRLYFTILLESFLADIRFSLRWLRKSPGFTLVAVASLAIGIGFNTALFTIVDALLFKPGTYSNTANIGYYTSIAGLGQNPDDVTINGDVTVDAFDGTGNATQNFWRSAENLSVNPIAPPYYGGAAIDQWAVSQAAPLRRIQQRWGISDGESPAPSAVLPDAVLPDEDRVRV